MNYIKRIFENRFKKTTCPRCLGKGLVDQKDINRCKRELLWTPGLCNYCNRTGKVTQHQINNVSVDDPFYPKLMDMDPEKKELLIYLTESEVKKARKKKEQPEVAEEPYYEINFNDKPEGNHNYGLHKKGFFYNDENYGEVEDKKGTLLGFYENLDDAKLALEQADINTFRKLKGTSAVDFFFDSPNYDEVFQKIEAYYKEEYNLSIKDKYYFDLPKQMNNKQALAIMDILKFSFHTIVEYEDPMNINLDSFPEFEIGDYNEFE